MPKFFFNLQEDQNFSRDDSGTEFPTVETAIAAAKKLLPALAKELSWGDEHSLDVTVLNDTGRKIFTANLRLTARNLDACEALRR